MNYVRFQNLSAESYDLEGLEHYAEEQVVFYTYPYINNAVYRLVSVNKEGSRITDDREMMNLVIPYALGIWLPEVGDEILIDGKYGVIVGCEIAGKKVDVLSDDVTIQPKTMPDVFRESNHPLIFTNSRQPPTRRDFHCPSIYGIHITYLSTDGLISGEYFMSTTFKGLYSKEIKDLANIAFNTLEEMRKHVLPVLGRDKVDICRINGSVGAYRIHYGCRGIRPCKCANSVGTEHLVAGNAYYAHSMDENKNLALISEAKSGIVRLYRNDRFDYK